MYFLDRSLTILRNMALNKTSHIQIEDFVDAIHNIPELLSDWQFCDEKLLVKYLEDYDKKWRKSQDDVSLVSLYHKSKEIKLLGQNEVLFDSDKTEIQDKIEILLKWFLMKIAPTKDNKTALYRDKSDGRLWELFDLHGGKLYVRPFGLRLISNSEALAKYDLSESLRKNMIR